MIKQDIYTLLGGLESPSETPRFILSGDEYVELMETFERLRKHFQEMHDELWNMTHQETYLKGQKTRKNLTVTLYVDEVLKLLHINKTLIANIIRQLSVEGEEK